MTQFHTGQAVPKKRQQRRLLLTGMLSVYTVAMIPRPVARAASDFGYSAFLAVSAILVGSKSLDVALGQRFYDALVDNDSGFPAGVRNVLTLINMLEIDPLLLQKTLDDAHPKMAAIPRKIMAAWYLGIIGSGENARCLAYENALNAVVVSDVLVPPTYADGAYGSWASQPKDGSHDG